MIAAIETNAGEVAIRYADASKLVSVNTFKTLQTITTRLRRIVATEKLDGGILEKRTGTLQRALFDRVQLEEQDAVGRVGFDLGKAKYARIQELGGVVTAKNAAHLTIPLAAVKTGTGVATFTAREVIANPQAFGFWGTFTAKGVIFGRVRDSSVPPTPLFALKKSVTLPARRPLGSTLDRERGWILEQMGAGVGEAATQIATSEGAPR